MHEEIMHAFAAGVGKDAKVYPLSGPYVPCDIAVVIGLPRRSSRDTWPKQKQYTKLDDIYNRHKGRSLIVIEFGFIHRRQYLSTGFGGIGGFADFRTEGVGYDRFKALGVELKPWRFRRQGPVVVCGQLPWDATVINTGHVQWCASAVEYYQSKGVPVLFRPHPRITLKDDKEGWQRFYKGIDPSVVDTRPLPDVLDEARCVVTWSSNVGVDAVLAGVPVIAQDPGSMIYNLSRHELQHYDAPAMPNRHSWCCDIGYSQWSLDEHRQGLAFKHLMR